MIIKLKDLLKEAISNDDLEAIKRIVRKELSEILFDLYKKRNTWV